MINAKPVLSTMNLTPIHRIIGSKIEIIGIDDDVPVQESDLAADTFWNYYQSYPEFRAEQFQTRMANYRLLKWAQKNGSFSNREDTIQNIETASICATGLYHYLHSEEVTKKILEDQEHLEELQKQRDNAQNRADQARENGDEYTAETMQQNADKLSDEMEALQAAMSQALDELEGDATAGYALKAAMSDVQKEAGKVADAMAGWGLEGGQLRDPNAIRDWRKFDDARLRRIAEIAGRVKGLGLRPRKQPQPIGFSMVGIHMSQDPALILPSELARLSPQNNSLLRSLALAEYMDGGLLSVKLGADATEQGPFVACVDRSGSMDGDQFDYAMGLALGLAWIAREQGREYVIGTFGSHDDPIVAIRAGDTWQQHMEWATQRANAGTDFNKPLSWAMGEVKASTAVNQTDILFLTDGMCRTDVGILQSVVDFNQETGSRLIYVGIGSGTFGDVAAIAQTKIEVSTLTLTEVDNLAQTVGETL